MSSAAVALEFPAFDAADAAQWSEDQEELAANSVADNRARRLEALRNGLRIGQRDGSPTGLDALKAEVAMVVAGGRGAGPAWPTGVALLDAALGGGVPRGRVTEVVGPLGAGKTSLVRQLAAQVLAEGGWVAWVDATRTLAPQDLAQLGERLVVVRPHDHTRGAWCADLLLRSGTFALVVLDGAPLLSRTLGVRLSQLARERDAAFVVLREGTQGTRLGGAVRLQLRPLCAVSATSRFRSGAGPRLVSSTRDARREAGREQRSEAGREAGREQRYEVGHKQQHETGRKFSVLVEKGGSYQTLEVNCAIVVACRVCAHTEIPDRRGVARRSRVAAGTGSEHARTGSTTTAESVHEHANANEHNHEHKQEHEHEHAVPAALPVPVAGTHNTPTDAAWKQGRGRPRMAESSYGRHTRRGEARKLLHAREQTRGHNREQVYEHA